MFGKKNDLRDFKYITPEYPKSLEYDSILSFAKVIADHVDSNDYESAIYLTDSLKGYIERVKSDNYEKPSDSKSFYEKVEQLRREKLKSNLAKDLFKVPSK